MARQQLRHLFLEKSKKDGDGEDPPRRRKGMQLDHTTAQGKKMVESAVLVFWAAVSQKIVIFALICSLMTARFVL